MATERRRGAKRKAGPGAKALAYALSLLAAGAALLSRGLFPIVVTVAVLAGFLVFAHAYYETNPVFTVDPEAIVIRGNATLTREQVLQNFGLDGSVNGFDLVRGDLVARLRRQSPLIKNVTMTYQPGRSLELWVEERTPLARLAGTPLPLVVDEEGVCFIYPRPRDAYPEIGGFDLPEQLAPGAHLPPNLHCMLHLIAATASPDWRLPGTVARVFLLSDDPADGLRVTLRDGRKIVIAWPGMATETGASDAMLRRLANVATALRQPSLAGKRHFNAMAADAVSVSD